MIDHVIEIVLPERLVGLSKFRLEPELKVEYDVEIIRPVE
jgi:hypothetical protein